MNIKKQNNIDKYKAIFLAFLAALLYSINIPLSKLLLDYVSPTFMASFLYFGAGIGVLIMYLFKRKNEDKSKKLDRCDLKYTILMILLDIFAPILLMFGIKYGNSSNASLLGNFEVVATSLLALLLFSESISSKLWLAILFITMSSIVLSFDTSGFSFSIGSILVLLATICWGLENNCTRKISNKSTYQIVILKGIFSGLVSFIISLLLKESIPGIKYILLTLILGYVAYGLSIFTYVRAQNILGAPKTSLYYAINPFIGSLLSFILLKETLNSNYLIGLVLNIIGTIFVMEDTLLVKHSHTILDNGKEVLIEHTHFRYGLGNSNHNHK